MNWYKRATSPINPFDGIQIDPSAPLDEYGKQSDEWLVIRAWDTVKSQEAGYLLYHFVNGELDIDTVETHGPYQRKGLATAMVQQMFKDNPGRKMMQQIWTGKGSQFAKGLTQKGILNKGNYPSAYTAGDVE